MSEESEMTTAPVPDDGTDLSQWLSEGTEEDITQKYLALRHNDSVSPLKSPTKSAVNTPGRHLMGSAAASSSAVAEAGFQAFPETPGHSSSPDHYHDEFYNNVHISPPQSAHAQSAYLDVVDRDLLEASLRKELQHAREDYHPGVSRATSMARRKRTSDRRPKPMKQMLRELEPLNRQPLRTPGPGAYTPRVDHLGRSWTAGKTASAYTFGIQDKSHIDKHLSKISSPGPLYMPVVNTSLHRSLPNVKIGNKGFDSRFDLNEGYEHTFVQPKNHPHWNPGSGDYRPKTHKAGGATAAGGDVPQYSIGRSTRQIPAENLPAVALIGEDFCVRENIGIFSPGPKYNPEHTYRGDKIKAPLFTTRPRCKTQWENLLHPERVAGPGPVYKASDRDRHGGKTWGERPVLFPQHTRYHDPELTYSANSYISLAHAKRSNAGVHSPGPVYKPVFKEDVMSNHVRALSFTMSGHHDRFHDRFEQGRVG